MSNYPPGVNDNDPHFDLPNAHEDGDDGQQWACSGCGALLSADMVDSLQGHTRVGEDGNGNPIEIHCGPCDPFDEDSWNAMLNALNSSQGQY